MAGGQHADLCFLHKFLQVRQAALGRNSGSPTPCEAPLLRRRGVSGGIARGFSHLGSRAATFFLGFREGFRVFGARVLGTVFRALGFSQKFEGG